MVGKVLRRRRRGVKNQQQNLLRLLMVTSSPKGRIEKIEAKTVRLWKNNNKRYRRLQRERTLR